ncbi:MAG: EAL domain-containing protein [Gammaproteobacteria bacterium]|nr:EAL domain-containing protein [Gammaproteobacteria bacterium]
MPNISPAIRVSTGLVLLTISILLIGDMFGFIPKHQDAVFKSREKIADSLAVQISAAAYANQLRTLQATLDGVVKRNEEILSAALRRVNGRVIAQTSEHRRHWLNSLDESTSTHIKVTLLKDKSPWGHFELVFSPPGAISTSSLIDSPLIKLLLFAAVSGFFGYLLFIKKSLREMDPSKVVPAHVKATLDSLAEGVIILDENERIVLTNSTFADRVNIEPGALIGKKASSLNWKALQSTERPQSYPWFVAVKQKENQTGIPLTFETKQGEQLEFMVNSSPILDGKNNVRGAMATFDDVTQLEKKNSDLKTALQMLRSSRDEIQEQNEKLELLATRDPLTNCRNRRSFFARLEQAFSQAKEDGIELSAIMCDIDHFKAVNDKYGHAKGDDVIKQVANLISSSLRSSDALGRYGGEEFCAFLPGMGVKQATALAERIRQRIERSDIELDVTLSFGVSSLKFGAASSADLVNQADEALYLSKRAGRNRVTSYDKKEEIEKSLASQNDNQGDIERESRLLGLPDLSTLYSKLKIELDRAQNKKMLAAILMINLDRFKGIIHTLGQSVSEQLLADIEKRLREALRRNDFIQQLNSERGAGSVERISHEEFMVVLTDLQHVDEIKNIAQRLMELIAKPLEVADNEVLVTCSMGVSVFPEHSEMAEDLVNKAAIALYEASRLGRNQLQFYTDEVKNAATEAVRIESKLSHAIERNEFHLVYQPRIELQSGRITCVEALLRWENPELGSVSPVIFIPLAEDSGIIIDIGEWVLRESCRQVKEWHEEGMDDVRVSVNLSTKQLLDEQLINKIKQTLAETQVQPDWVEFEITETAIMENQQETMLLLERLKALGIHMSIDDFGTGYSSLSYLKHFPVDTLKIDRAFISDIVDDTHDQMLVTTISEIAHKFALTVVAEGVETHEQLAKLRQYNCDEIQGYIFSKPLLPANASALLKFNLGDPHLPRADSALSIPPDEDVEKSGLRVIK